MLIDTAPHDPRSSAHAVAVYTTEPECIRCVLTKRVLTEKGVRFLEVDIRSNDAAREYVVDDLGYTEAPVVVVTDEDHWCGFRPDKIDALAKRAILPSDATREARTSAR